MRRGRKIIRWIKELVTKPDVSVHAETHMMEGEDQFP